MNLSQMKIFTLSIKVWTGRKKLRPEDIGISAGSTPPEVVSLGVKNTCPQERLRVFNTLRGRAERACQEHGLPFLGAYAVPNAKAAELSAALEELREEFLEERTRFLADYNAIVEDWVQKHPRFEVALRKAITPVSIVSALTAAARQGVLIKGGAHLERLGAITCVAFDKTGTLTEGRIEVTDVIAVDGVSARGVLAVAAALEARSEHPIGRAIVSRAQADGLEILPGGAFRALPGLGFRGVNVTIPNKEAALELADAVSPRAEAIGAANTLTFADGAIHADNTDGYGFIANLRQQAPAWSAAAGPALVLGAGGSARAVVQALLAEGAPEVRIANRTRARAESLASRFDASAHGLEELPDLLAGADVMLTSIAGDGPLVQRDDVERALRGRGHRPLFVIDLGVPRNVDPRVDELDGVYLYDIDDLGRVAEANAEERRREKVRAEAIVLEEAQRFDGWLAALAAVPTIRDLRARAERIRSHELERAVARLQASESPREVLEALTRAIVNKLLHAPISKLRGQEDREQGLATLEAARALFALDEGEPEAEPPQGEES